MRTTVTVEDALLREARESAARSGRTLGQVVEDGLRLLLHRHEEVAPVPVELPVFGGSGLRPGVDLEDKDALADLLDEPESSRAAG